MTEEIKEIELDHFNNINELKQNVETWIKEDDMYWDRWFSLYDLKTLLDYITNLQQENERLNNIINELEDYVCGIEYDERFYNETWQIAVRIHNKLKELKESGNNETNN